MLQDEARNDCEALCFHLKHKCAFMINVILCLNNVFVFYRLVLSVFVNPPVFKHAFFHPAK